MECAKLMKSERITVPRSCRRRVDMDSKNISGMDHETSQCVRMISVIGQRIQKHLRRCCSSVCFVM